MPGWKRLHFSREERDILRSWLHQQCETLRSGFQGGPHRARLWRDGVEGQRTTPRPWAQARRENLRPWLQGRDAALHSWFREQRETLRPRLRSSQRYLPQALIVTGILILGYVALQYSSMYFQQRRLAREWQRQQQLSTMKEPLSTSTSSGLTRISAPRIGLDAIIVEGTSRKSLLLGPGHMPNTPQPGEMGNSVLTGHRDTFFRHIHELIKGDMLTVQRGGQTYEFEVIGKRVVDPDDMSVLRPSSQGQLTLITCYPTYYVGPAPDRLVVFTRLVSQPRQASSQSLVVGR